ncbi:MAG: LLM class flavin-dependent oxidoreductase [Ilumatobacteraceae bacterium]|nr:LLM class flavin-dependent oxidoreductase [Ilumatobacteraceae bacterium]
MALTFEAEITPGMSTREVVDLARLAEEVGFDRLGISDVVLWPDCYVLMALVAQATERIAIGPMVTNPYSRHPVVLAGAMAALQDASDGRMFLGIGVGAGLEQLGMTYPRPVRALREAITVIRALLRGETVTLAGETITVDAARMVGPVAPVPISIGSRSPQVMRLAGEVADVALVGGRTLDQRIADQYRGWLAEGAARVGRDVGEIEVAPRLTLCVSHDGDLARRSMQRYAAHYVALIRPPDLVARDDGRWIAEVEAALARSSGWYFDHDRVDDPAIGRLIDDDVVRRFAISGTPSECVELTREVLALGFDGASMNLAAPRRESMYAGLRETLELSADVLAAVRSG